MENLLLLFLVPFITSAIAFVFPIKRVAFLMSLAPLIILLLGQTNWIGASVQYPWLPQLSVEFHLSVDSLSLLFLYLTAVITPISILVFPNGFYGFVLLLQGLLIGFFTARDLALFTVFWEAMLLPLYFIINSWGGAERQRAALKFLIYMIAGSVFMVAAVLALYFLAGGTTFNLGELARTAENSPYTPWLLAIFLLAFAVKTPLFPFHAWLSDAYYFAPTAGTILLSALLSKAGIYGILRIGIGLFPATLQQWSVPLLILAIIGVFYGALVAWMQPDYKRLIAYSSFSHVNFILAGIFVMDNAAETGAILQALNHGVTITALFLVAYWLELRLGTTSMDAASGLARYFPHLCWLTLFFVLSNVALPGTNNFIGELLILFGLFVKNPPVAAVLGLSIIFSVIYMLRWMQKVYFETPTPLQSPKGDIRIRDYAIALPLVAIILWVGFYPNPIINLIKQR